MTPKQAWKEIRPDIMRSEDSEAFQVLDEHFAQLKPKCKRCNDRRFFENDHDKIVPCNLCNREAYQ